MKNINDYKKRFYNLMESTLGDVRPLIMEQSGTTQTTGGTVTTGSTQTTGGTVTTGATQTQKSPKFMINKTQDKNYVYYYVPLTGKYYFMGQPNTPANKKYPKPVEATGAGLESIKKNVKFTPQPPPPSALSTSMSSVSSLTKID
jgi:hypothetical protein